MLYSNQIDAQDSTEVMVEVQDTNSWLPLDTNQVAWFEVSKPTELHSVDDSTLTRFQQYDPARKQIFDWVNLGSVGSPALPLFFRPKQNLGFYTGLDAFQLYTRTADQMRFYKINKSYTNLHFNRGLSQEDNSFSAEFSRNFKSRLNLSLQYDRNNSITDYANDRGRNTQFNIGLWYTSKRNRYQSFLIYGDQSVSRLENGGITTDTLFDAPASQQRVNIPVWLRTANSRYSAKTISSKHQYQFKKDPKTDGASLTAFYDLQYGNSTYKFYDANSVFIPAYYQQFQTDDRGVREFIHVDYLENRAQLQWEIQNRISDDTSSILVRAGLKYTNFWVNQEPLRETRTATFAEGNIQMNYRKNIHFEAMAQIGLLKNKGEILLKPNLDISYPSIGKLEVNAVFRIGEASLISQRNYITQKLIWDNNFRKEKNYGVNGNFNITKLNLSIFGSWNIMDDYIYFDTQRNPEQFNGTVQIIQLGGMHHLAFGNMNLDNTVGLQKSNQDIIHVPEWFSKHSLYWQRNLFKRAARLQLGADCRLTDSYHLNAYEPIIGQFYIQNEDQYPVNPIVDIFANLRIKSFRGFVKLENMLNLFDKSVNIQVASYPLPDWGLRFGIGWVFKD
ncbi:MAG: putative porin [Saprospiraceae bacterium]